MKKALCLILSLIMAVASVPIAAYAADSTESDIKVYSDDVTAEAGSTIKVPVYISGNTGILGWKLMFTYDETMLTPTSVDYGEVISSGIQDNIDGDAEAGSFNVYWAGSDNEDYNGIMFYVNFTVADNAVGTTSVEIDYSQADTFDTDFNDVALECSPFSVTVSNSNYSSYIKNTLSADSAEVTAGENVYISLSSVGDYTISSSAKHIYKFDSDNFEFVSFADSEKNAVSITGYTLESGVLTIPESLTDGFSYICFKANDYANRGTYTFDFDLTDSGIDSITNNSCSVKINKSSTSEIAEIYAPDGLQGNAGETVDVPVYIKNNHGIMGYKLTFDYDSSALEIVSASSGDDFFATFNTTIENNTPGTFFAVWNNTSEIAKDGILLNLQFSVISEEKADTTVSVSYSQPDTFNEAYEDVVFNCSDITISLNPECQHDYVGGITTAATCSAEGVKTYTCSKCGNTYTEAIEKIDHSYGEYTYNGDAVYNSSKDYTDGTQTRTCTVCGESETVTAPNTALLCRRGSALSLESSITLATYITKDIVDYYDEVYAEFTRNNKTTTVTASEKTLTSGSTVYNIFDYTGISPQAMSDDIQIVFYGTKDGVKYWGATRTYKVTDYITTTLGTTSSEKLKTLLVDLMYYGAACQTYANYKTDSLMTDLLTDDQKALKSSYTLELNNIRDTAYETCENRLVKLGTALRLSNAVEMSIPMIMTDITIDEIMVKVKIGTRELAYTYADNPENFEYTGGYWYFYFDGVYANQMSDEVFISVYEGDEQVSYTLRYSVESYAALVTDASLKEVTDAMMYYGNSAKAYAES